MAQNFQVYASTIFLTACEPNQKVVNGECIDCAAGKEPSMDRTTCEQCPADKFFTEDSTCMMCPVGEIPNNDQSACVGMLCHITKSISKNSRR